MSAADFTSFFADDADLLQNGGGYAAAVPAAPDTSDLGVSSLPAPSDAQLGPPAVDAPPPSSRFDLLRQPAPDLGPPAADGPHSNVAMRPPAAPIAGPFAPTGGVMAPFRGAGLFGPRGR